MTKVALISYQIVDSNSWDESYLTVTLEGKIDDNVEWFDLTEEEIKLLKNNLPIGSYNGEGLVLIEQGANLVSYSDLTATSLPELLAYIKEKEEKKKKAATKRKATREKNKKAEEAKKLEEEKRLLEELKKKYEK